LIIVVSVKFSVKLKFADLYKHVWLRIKSLSYIYKISVFTTCHNTIWLQETFGWYL